MSDHLIDDLALCAAFAKYERGWSDAECPITEPEKAAYIVGWNDSHDHYMPVLENIKQAHKDYLAGKLKYQRDFINKVSQILQPSEGISHE